MKSRMNSGDGESLFILVHLHPRFSIQSVHPPLILNSCILLILCHLVHLCHPFSTFIPCHPLSSVRLLLPLFSVHPLSSVYPLSILCPSSVHALSILCPSSVHPLSILCPSSVHPLSILCPSSVDPLSILCYASSVHPLHLSFLFILCSSPILLDHSLFILKSETLWYTLDSYSAHELTFEIFFPHCVCACQDCARYGKQTNRQNKQTGRRK
jgi:hypothetical protein